MNNCIIVTGGAGFIGSNFVNAWVKLGLGEVVNLDKLTYAGNLANLAEIEHQPEHVFVHGDIGNRALVDALLKQYQPRAIVNFAAESHVDRSIHAPGEFIQTNIVGTFNLLEATRAYWGGLNDVNKDKFRFLHVSTDEVYGSLSSTDPAFKETNTYQPNSPYSASKAASDHLVRACGVNFAVRTTLHQDIIRCCQSSDIADIRPNNVAYGQRLAKQTGLGLIAFFHPEPEFIK